MHLLEMELDVYEVLKRCVTSGENYGMNWILKNEKGPPL